MYSVKPSSNLISIIPVGEFRRVLDPKIKSLAETNVWMQMKNIVEEKYCSFLSESNLFYKRYAALRPPCEVSLWIWN